MIIITIVLGPLKMLMRLEKFIPQRKMNANQRNKAFDSLYVDTDKYIKRLSSFYLYDRETAEDAAQEACIKILIGLRSFNPKRNARAWAGTVARNSFKDQIRRTSVLTNRYAIKDEQYFSYLPAKGGDQLSTIINDIDDEALRVRVASALGVIPARESQYLVDYYFNDLTYAQLMVKYNKSYSQISHILTLSRKKLKHSLEEKHVNDK